MNGNSFDSVKTLNVAGRKYQYYSLKSVAAAGFDGLEQLPFTIKILLENLLRKEDGDAVKRADIVAVANWQPQQTQAGEISYSPARVLMQDFTGVPAIVDLAAMRDAVAKNGGDPANINPQIPVDLVIDHSVM
ncbi:MAG: aconitate hydratase, partial [Desulfuromusa sp.]|nr:aconitate hydratase [Desulfuromusa sp.]